MSLDAAKGHSPDLEQVNLRLAGVSETNIAEPSTWQQDTLQDRRVRPATEAANEGFAESSDDETVAYDKEDERRDKVDDEVGAYSDLVSDGGHPLYPISHLEQVSRHPEEHRGKLRPFWGYPRDHQSPWLVYQRQLKRWRDFRKWQIDNRGLKEDDGGFPAYVEKMKQLYAKDRFTVGLAKIKADPMCLQPGWEYNRQMRNWQKCYQREKGCNGFSDYADALKRRLVRHGFARPFQLREDPQRQDALTTWIEYLGFEYWWLDRHQDSVNRLEPDYNERWQQMVVLKVLKPHETKDFIRTTPSSMERGREQDQAWTMKVAAEAEAKRLRLRKPADLERICVSEEEHLRVLQAAKAKAAVAHERYESTKRRFGIITSFIRATFDYEDAKRNAACHAALVQWVADQIPLVEAELRRSPTPDSRLGQTSKKRSLAQYDASKTQQKRRKLDPGTLLQSEAYSSHIDSAAVNPGGTNARRLGPTRNTPTPLRRSARITERASCAQSSLASSH